MNACRRLSVIIPGYETPEWMWRRCVESVLSATTDEDEVICVDDGSRINILPEFNSCRVVELRLGTNGGQSKARNMALDVARGDWITFVDSDDEVVGDVYSRSLQRLAQTGDDVVVFGVRTIWPDVNLVKDNVPSGEISGRPSAKVVRALFDNDLFEYVWNKIYRREFLESNKIRFDKTVCPGEDTIFNLDVLLNGASLSAVDCIGYDYYRMDGSSLSRYLPNIRESRRKYCDAWTAVKQKFGNDGTALAGVGDMDDRAIAFAEWNNMWRRGNPFSLHEKWTFSRANGFSFVRMVLKISARRFFYFGFVKRLMLKRAFPAVFQLSEEKNETQIHSSR